MITDGALGLDQPFSTGGPTCQQTGDFSQKSLFFPLNPRGLSPDAADAMQFGGISSVCLRETSERICGLFFQQGGFGRRRRLGHARREKREGNFRATRILVIFCHYTVCSERKGKKKPKEAAKAAMARRHRFCFAKYKQRYQNFAH